jgi:tetratricopeptide (TPR) repeat protein
MHKKFLPWLLAVALILAPACRTGSRHSADEATADRGVDQAVEEARAAYDAAETADEKFAIARTFFAEYPESDHTADVLAYLAESMVDDLDRPEEARILFEDVVASIADQEVKLGAQVQLAKLYAKTGDRDELRELSHSITQDHKLAYTDYLDLMDTALTAESWDLLVEQSDASLKLATPEAFQAQYEEMTHEEAEEGGRRRVAYSSAFKGWALANLGQTEAALETFSRAAQSTSYSLLGTDDTDLHFYWGKTLAQAGDPQGAMEKLQVEAIFGSDEARETYTECWTAVHGSPNGLDDHLWELRQQHAPELPQFALNDYSGERVSTADFAGKVLLIAAWNPG